MRTTLTITAVALAGMALLLREAAADAWEPSAAIRIAALVAFAAALVLSVRARNLPRRAIALLLVLLATAASLRLVSRVPGADVWRAQEEKQLAERFADSHTALLGLEEYAHELGREANALWPDSSTAPLAAERRAALFESLAHLLAARRPARPPMGGVGVQLFDAQGELIAWAGTPRALQAGARLTRFTGSPSNAYMRRSGVYTLLSCEERDPHGNLRALVDVPVEVHYRISNRFLQSRSLPEELSGHGVEVSFVYDALEVPTYLVGRDFELLGDEDRGIQAWGLLRDVTGAPFVLCRLNGLPYRDSVEQVKARAEDAMGWLLAAAVAVAWIALAGALRGHPSRSWWSALSPVAFIAAVWSVRLLLALLGLPSSHGGGALANPAAFAMVGFAGMLRSPLDLLLTTLALGASVAMLFVHMARRAANGSTPGSDPEPKPAQKLVRLLLAALATAGSVWVAFLFVQRVAADSNPHLVGPRLDLLSPAVACLELAVLAGVVSWLGLSMLAAHGLARRPGRSLVLILALAVFAVLARQTSLVTALAGAGVFLAAMQLGVLLRDQRFTSFGLASFALVAIATTLVTDALHHESFRANQARAREATEGILGPGDELRRFVLDDLLHKVQQDATLRDRLNEAGAERSALAFEVWAQSMLSHLGYACEVRVYDATGTLTSQFAVDMPSGPEDPARELLEKARLARGVVTETGAEPSAAGPVRAYRGAVAVRSGDPQEYAGAVVVNLPYAHSSLDVAADPRTRTPEVLRNLQEEGIGPRLDDSERLLLAWLEKGFVVESSTPYLEVGEAPHIAASETWQRLRLVNGDYWVMRAGPPERALLAGFRRATPLDRLLEWAQIGSFSFLVTLLALLGVVALGRITNLQRRLPLLLVPKRLGFQQKLMVAFLVLSLLPSVVLSVATRDIMRDRSLRRNRDAALTKARAAEAALADLVRRDLDAVRESEYLRSVLSESEAPPVRDIGHLEFSQIMVFHADGRIVLDETLSNLSDEQARELVRRAPTTAFASRDGRYLCLAAFEKVWFSPTEGMSETAADAQPYWVFYRRRLTDHVLRNLAPILSTDISGFLGPHLAVSSQKSLATAGLLPSLVPPEAYAHVMLRRNRYAVVEESTGSQRYFAGYLPLEDATGARIGALAVSQLLQPDEFAVEVEKTKELVLGLSTLMFVLTLVLGVFFATRIFDPVRNLIEGTRRIAGGDLGFRLRARSGDEIGELERSFNEMTSRLQEAARALDERRRYLEAVLGNIASGVIATDAAGRITAANPAAYRILRLSPESLQGRTWAELAGDGSGRDIQHFWRRLGEAPGGEVVEIPVHGAVAAVAPNGPARPAAVADLAAQDDQAAASAALERLTLRVIVTDLLPALGTPGERLGRVAIFEDVSELIRSKKLSAWAEMARQVAHEIKNPLTPMKLSAQFMEQAFRDKSPKFPRIFEEGMATIVQQVESLRRIATEFSNFGRVQKLEPRPLDLADLLRSVTVPYAQVAGLELDVSNGDADGLRVLGDAEGLRRVFRNVFENAREAMGGRGRIALSVLRPSPDRVQVRIADEGPGISAEAAVRLFEPYFSTKTTGTGLGLAISRSIVEELGGTLQLVNRPGGGAEACVTLVVC